MSDEYGEPEDRSREPSFEDEIRSRLRDESFKPFELILSSGDRFEVTSPFSLAMGESSMTVYPPRSTSVLFRKSQVVAIRVLEPVS